MDQGKTIGKEYADREGIMTLRKNEIRKLFNRRNLGIFVMAAMLSAAFPAMAYMGGPADGQRTYRNGGYGYCQGPGSGYHRYDDRNRDGRYEHRSPRGYQGNREDYSPRDYRRGWDEPRRGGGRY
jgi:hypothetical protein